MERIRVQKKLTEQVRVQNIMDPTGSSLEEEYPLPPVPTPLIENFIFSAV